MYYEKKFLIGDYVKGKRTFNGEVIEGKFNGFHLYNKLNPKSVVGVIDTDERCYDVSVDSIESLENEDEKIMKDLIEFVNQYGDKFYGQIAKVSAISWLEKQGGQPTWNKEDEGMIECIIAAIKMGDYYTQDELNRMTSWLKSLKPNNWKPSEKQMEELEYITRGNSYPYLSSLYNDLKSL